MSGGHFKLGLFIVGATALLILSLLLLGVLDRFRSSVTIETYSDQSIQNLVVGSAVRYRGVQIGRVSHIGFARETYPEIARDERAILGETILIEMKIDDVHLKRLRVDDLWSELPQSIEDGLRVRLASTGLGGPMFMEFAYLDPQVFPALDVPWTPQHPYVASAPSTVTALLDSLSKILNRLSDDQALDDLASILQAGNELGGLIAMLQDDDGLTELTASLNELADAGNSLSTMLDGDRLSALVDDASAVLRSARQVLDDEGPEGIRPLIRSLSTMADALERTGTAMDGLVAEIDESNMIQELETLASELGPAGQDLAVLAARLDRLVRTNEAGIADLIRSLRRATAQLQGLLEEAEQNPSRMIFGDPPPRRTPGESR